MNKFLRFLTMAVLIFTFAQHVNAAYLKNVPQTITQPDGTVIKCFATGDEFHNWLHDENNYTIIQGQDGVYYYAVKSGDQIVPSEYVVGKTFLKSTHLTPGVNLSPEQIMEKRRRKFEGIRLNCDNHRVNLGQDRKAKLENNTGLSSNKNLYY